VRSRSVRRHHERRLKSRTRAYFSGIARHNPRVAGKLAHCRTPCSCWMCGNPRRYSGEVTLQERRAALTALDADDESRAIV
jgi:hypothetical protein